MLLPWRTIGSSWQVPEPPCNNETQGSETKCIEASLETKLKQVKNKLKDGSAVLVFDDETETTNIFLADDSVLKKIDKNGEQCRKPSISNG